MSAPEPFVTIQVAPATDIGALAAERLSLAVARCPAAFLGMATGSTPKVTGFWDELRQRVSRGQLDLSKATFVNPDEWIGLGDPEHAEAYLSYLKKELAFETNIRVPDGCAADPVQAALDVEQAIVAGGGFEWMLMGMGINGHIGFFEPADSLPSQAFTPAIDRLNRERYARDHFGTLDAVPTHRPWHSDARQRNLLVCGGRRQGWAAGAGAARTGHDCASREFCAAGAERAGVSGPGRCIET
jgi:glucosamine-6-phosphate deaminase